MYDLHNLKRQADGLYLLLEEEHKNLGRTLPHYLSLKYHWFDKEHTDEESLSEAYERALDLINQMVLTLDSHQTQLELMLNPDLTKPWGNTWRSTIGSPNEREKRR